MQGGLLVILTVRRCRLNQHNEDDFLIPFWFLTINF